MSISTNFDAVSNNIDDLSFGLLRTNPKLTTNIKLVVSSDGSLHMDSIAANNSLSNNSYRNYSVHPDGKYSNDVALFYGLKTPNQTKYAVLRENSDLSVHSEYSKQYEDIYQYGAYFNSSKITPEQYRFFAPIWLEKNIPSYFVIYRVEDVDYSSQLDDSVNSQNYRVLELLSKSTIVKTFDLTKTSNIGKYLSNHVNDSKFPNSAITHNFDPKQATLFNGIDVTNGGFVSKKEFLGADLLADKIEILNNYILTSGFERNEIASANLINLEFLFDDANADNYKIYRYFGLYVDAIEEGEFDSIGSMSNFLQLDESSINTFYNINGLSVTHREMFLSDEDLKMPTLNWVKNSAGDFYHIKNNINFNNSSPLGLPVSLNGAVHTDFSNKTRVDSIQLEDFLVELKDLFDLNIVEIPHNGDKIFLAPKSELEARSYDLDDFEFVAESDLPAGKYLNNTYSCQGSTKDVAIALAGAITASEIPYTAKYIAGTSRIIIEDYGVGSTRKLTALGILNGNISNFIYFNTGLYDNIGLVNSILPMGADINFTEWSIWTPIGGASKNNSVLVKAENLGSTSVDNYLQGVNTNKYSKIKQIVKDPYLTDVFRIILENPIEVPNTKTLNVYSDYKTLYGKFSAYSIKDFDFDFYDTSNSELGELKLEDLIVNLNSYSRYAIACDPRFSQSVDDYYPTLYPVLEQEVVNKREIITSFNQDADLIIKDSKISSEYDRLHENQLKETSTYSRISPTINKFALKNSFNARMKPYMLTYSEAFGSDNMSPVVMTGRFRDPVDYSMEYFHINTIPSIYESDEKDVRLLKSYIGFNSSITNEFTKDNLKRTDLNYFDKFFVWDGAYTDAVSISKIELIGNITKVTFTGNISPAAINGNKLTSYSGFVFELPSNIIYGGNLNEISFIGDQSLDPNENNKLQVGDIFEAKDTVFIKAATNKMYSVFENGTEYNFSSTIFRGLRYIFKARKENNRSNPSEFKTDNINGYKFGVVLNLETESDSNDITTEVIKNDKFKFVCVYINFRIQSGDVNEITRKVLYELRHAVKDGSIINTKINGALNLRQADWNSSNGIVIKGIADKFNNLPIFEKQINIIKANEIDGYSYLLFDWKNYLTDEIEVKALKIVDVLNNNTIKIDGYPFEWIEELDSLGNPTGKGHPGARWTGITSISKALQQTLTYTYYGGGYDAYREILESISAKNMVDTFNNNPSDISYTNISAEGDIYSNNFILNIEDGTQFVKPSFIYAAVDADKPLSYKITPEEVGKIISTRDKGYFVQLRRMNGDYNPLTKELVYFTDIYSEYKAINGEIDFRKKLIYDKFNHLGISFATYYGDEASSFGIIKNYFYHKVNPEAPDSTLKLSKASDKLPLYPKIGEIAIDRKNLNVLESKYSSNYFTKSLINSGVESAYGTASPIEKKSFMASTIMKVDDFYEITSYNSLKVNSLEELNFIKLNGDSSKSIVWTETEDKVYADFYIKNSVLDELIEQGIMSSFSKYISPAKSFGDLTTIEDDLKYYVEYNIVPRFIINSISIFAREAKNIETSFVNSISPNDIDFTIYKQQTNYAIESFDTGRLNFRLIYNKRYGYKYQFKIMVKLQA